MKAEPNQCTVLIMHSEGQHLQLALKYSGERSPPVIWPPFGGLKEAFTHQIPSMPKHLFSMTK